MAANIVTSIPLEIAQAILSSCSDSQTLRGLLLSCTFFFNAYSSAKRHILLQVLQNLVKPELLQAVLLTLESPQYIGSEDLFERYHHIIVPVPQSLQLVDLHSIGRLMKSVECLTELLISREFICNPRSNQPFNPPLTLSEEEKDRIKRNLLWYQTYCTVGAGIGNDGAAAMKTRRFFHKYFATWETEQLFTVAFWLDRLLIDACGEKADQIIGSRILHADIEKIAHLTELEDPEDRDQWIDELLRFHEDVNEYSIPMEINNLLHPNENQRAWHEEPDDGPQTAWEWAFDDERGDYAETIVGRFSNYGVYLLDSDTLRRYDVLSVPPAPGPLYVRRLD